MAVPKLTQSGALVILVAALTTGCQSQSKSAGDPLAINSDAITLMEQSPGSGSVDGEDLVPLRDAEHQFQILDEKGRPDGQLICTGASTTKHDATFAVTCGNERVEFYRINENGDVAMTAVIDHAEKALTRFSPPLVVAFKEMPAGQEFVSEAEMHVVDVNRPTKTRESGHCKRTVIYVGDQRVRTSLGEHVAKRVDSRFTADLKMANVDERTTFFFVPKTGVVAEHSVEGVKVLGAFGSTRKRTLVLSEAGASH